jgi:hypothetical protein
MLHVSIDAPEKLQSTSFTAVSWLHIVAVLAKGPQQMKSRSFPAGAPAAVRGLIVMLKGPFKLGEKVKKAGDC